LGCSTISTAVVEPSMEDVGPHRHLHEGGGLVALRLFIGSRLAQRPQHTCRFVRGQGRLIRTERYRARAVGPPSRPYFSVVEYAYTVTATNTAADRSSLDDDGGGDRRRCGRKWGALPRTATRGAYIPQPWSSRSNAYRTLLLSPGERGGGIRAAAYAAYSGIELRSAETSRQEGLKKPARRSGRNERARRGPQSGSH